MELAVTQPFFEQDDHSGDLPAFDGQNGVDKNGQLWVDGKKAKISKRKPRWKKDGSLSSVHSRQVTGDQRDMGAGVGGSVNTGHKRGLFRKLEDIVSDLVEKKNG